MFLSRLARSASSLASVSIARASAPRTAAVAAAAAASAVVLYDQLQQQQKAHSLAGHTSLVMSGDCGGTNTRLMVFRVPSGVKASLGKVPEHELVFAKKCVPSAPPPLATARARTNVARSDRVAGTSTRRTSPSRRCARSSSRRPRR
tara:strand:- start:216 stop:656 length:441 start_codon:yes stop_codon:yes gene_type:complete